MKYISIIIISFFIFSGVSGQSFIFPGDVFFDSENQSNLHNDTNALQFHGNMLPYNNAQKLYGQRNDDLYVPDKKIVGRKFLNEDLIELKHTDFETGYPRKFLLNISPILNFQGGLDFATINSFKTFRHTEKIYTNTRGVLVKSSIGEKFSFETIFIENQATLPSYQDSFALSTGVIPGSGRWKTFKLNGYDYAMASGYILFKANKNFSIQAGHGKHKIGNGYRSLLLSDNSFTYPYIRLTQNWWEGKIQYTNIYAVMMNLNSGGVHIPPGTERLFQKKAASFQYLSVNFNKYLNVSFFQSLIWEKPDTMNRQKITAEYFNPLIFSNLAFFGLNTAKNKNCMIGADICITPTKNFKIYGQIAIDELGPSTSLANKTGFQMGMKYYDVFTLKNLFIQFEFNQVRPYTYSANDPSLSYTQYNQSLAHPAGSNFKEAVAMLSYRWQRFFLQSKVNFLEQGGNAQGILVSTLNAPLTGNIQNGGNFSQTKIIDIKAGYLFNPKTNLNVSFGCLIRSQRFDSGVPDQNTNYFYIALKTSLYNQYWDF